MPLPRKAHTGLYDQVICNVWDITTKEIIFTGDVGECAAHLNATIGSIYTSLRRKGRIKKKYTIRTAKIIKP